MKSSTQCLSADAAAASAADSGGRGTRYLPPAWRRPLFASTSRGHGEEVEDFRPGGAERTVLVWQLTSTSTGGVDLYNLTATLGRSSAGKGHRRGH